MPFCVECGQRKSKLNKDKLCRECVDGGTNNKKSNNVQSIEEMFQSNEFANPSNYWENMNKLLDTKFDTFEQKFKANIMGEVKQLTEPIAKDVKDLTAENKRLKTSYNVESEDKTAGREVRKDGKGTERTSYHISTKRQIC